MFKKVIVAFCMLLFSSTAFAEGSGVQIDFSKISPNSHPRLLINENTFAVLKSRMETSPTLTKLHDIIMGTIEKEMKSNEELEYKFDVSGRRLLSISRRAILRVAAGAYAFKMTGDRQYVSYVERQLSAVCDFPNWNEKHYLDVGEMALAVSIGYDWLYDELDPEIKLKAEKAVNEHAFRTAIEKKYTHKFYKMLNNWNQVCNGGRLSCFL